MSDDRIRRAPLFERLDPRAQWADRALPDTARARLRELAEHVRSRDTIRKHWVGPEAHGITALFAGPSGTGKTFAVRALAHELGMPLIRADLGVVVTKHIGRTEKNLSKVFRAAESADALLLFDEADALFGKRTEVRDSRDRYANVEVGNLLERLEAHAGVVILVANSRDAIDPAFVRRVHFLVPFAHR